MDTSTLLLANLTLVGCMSLERLFKAFNVDLHAVKKVACSFFCCSADLLRNSSSTGNTPARSLANTPARSLANTPSRSSATTPVRSGALGHHTSFRVPEIEEIPYIARRSHSLEGYPGRAMKYPFNLEIDS